MNIKIVKLVNGEDVVAYLPQGADQLPEESKLIRLKKPLLIKYVPQMTMTGFKDYVGLIRWCSYTNDVIVTIPKDKIMSITNANPSMASSYDKMAVNYLKIPVELRFFSKPLKSGKLFKVALGIRASVKLTAVNKETNKENGYFKK